jgi:alpha-tubulin suppressor-like RCC1 family protein
VFGPSTAERRNNYGQLGLGDTTDRKLNTPHSTDYDLYTSIQTISSATSISLGVEHTCAVLGDGSVLCWGRNNYGQLGVGDTNDRLIPIAKGSLHRACAEVAPCETLVSVCTT